MVQTEQQLEKLSGAVQPGCFPRGLSLRGLRPLLHGLGDFDSGRVVPMPCRVSMPKALRRFQQEGGFLEVGC